MEAVRTALGADGFADRTVCGPAALAFANDWLSGTGLTASLEAEALRIRGVVGDEAAARRVVESMARSLNGLQVHVELEATRPVDPPRVPGPASAGDDPAGRRLDEVRTLLANRRGVMSSTEGADAVLLDDGTTYFAGDLLAPGVRLVAIAQNHATVAVGRTVRRLDLGPPVVTVGRTDTSTSKRPE